jgi:hypothetical protein
MKVPKRMIAVVTAGLTAAIFAVGGAFAGPAEDCEALLLAKDAGQINSAAIVQATSTLPEYCRVTATLPPAVNYEVRLPTSEWNGKLLHQGGGGFCGSVSLSGANDALARACRGVRS